MPLNPPLVIIVTGPPGSGKSALGNRLAGALQLPIISKDDIKEILFDTLGWKDRQWSMQLGVASMELLFHFLKCELRSGRPVIVETAFIPEFHTRRFMELKDEYDCEFFQIYCTADEEVLYERCKGRVEAGERHPGHVDHLINREQFKEMLHQGKYGQLEIGGERFVLDTTDFAKINYNELVAVIRSRQSGSTPA